MCTGSVTATARLGYVAHSRSSLVDVQIIGDDAKLLASHLENFVVVNRVNRCISATLGRPWESCYLRWARGVVNCETLECGDMSQVWVARASRVLASASRDRELFQVHKHTV